MYTSCIECCSYIFARQRCTEPRSPRFGNNVDDGLAACPFFHSYRAARAAIPKKKKWRKVKSIYDAEYPNARFY